MPQVKDYDSLTQAVLDFAHRPGIGPYIDYFIQDGEDRIYRTILAENQGRGLVWMENTLNLTIDATTGYAAVPADYLGLKAAQVSADSGIFDLKMRPAQWIYSHYPIRSATDAPSFIAREGSNFIFGPFPDSPYPILGTYYQRATALSSANPTTWMTANIPMALLAGCMAAAAKFLKDEQMMQGYLQELTGRLQEIIAADKAQDFGDDLQISSGNPAPPGW